MAKQTNPFADFDMSKMMTSMPFPTMNVDQMMDSYRKTIEAMTKANQVAMDGMQTVMRRQMEIARQNADEMASITRTAMATNGSAEDRVASSADLVKTTFERNLSQIKELNDVLSKSNGEALDVLNSRVSGLLDEFKSQAKAATANGGAKKTQ